MEHRTWPEQCRCLPELHRNPSHPGRRRRRPKPWQPEPKGPISSTFCPVLWQVLGENKWRFSKPTDDCTSQKVRRVVSSRACFTSVGDVYPCDWSNTKPASNSVNVKDKQSKCAWKCQFVSYKKLRRIWFLASISKERSAKFDTQRGNTCDFTWMLGIVSAICIVLSPEWPTKCCRVADFVDASPF